MAISNISLVAEAAYNKINTQPVTITPSANINDAASFHNMVETGFNKFAQMSPNQILDHINGVKSAQTINGFAQAGVAESVLGKLSADVKKHEQIMRKSVLNEASLVDLVTAANEANNTVKTMVVVRDKVLEAFDKIMNMQV